MPSGTAVEEEGGEKGGAQFIKVVHGEGETSYFNLDCSLQHLLDDLQARCLPSRPTLLDLCTEKGKSLDLQTKEKSQPPGEIVKSRGTYILVELFVDADSRPSSGVSASGKKQGKEEISGSKAIIEPLVDLEWLANHYPAFEVALPGGGGAGRAANSTLRRATLTNTRRKSITSLKK